MPAQRGVVVVVVVEDCAGGGAERGRWGGGREDCGEGRSEADYGIRGGLGMGFVVLLGRGCWLLLVLVFPGRRGMGLVSLRVLGWVWVWVWSQSGFRVGRRRGGG